MRFEGKELTFGNSAEMEGFEGVGMDDKVAQTMLDV